MPTTCALLLVAVDFNDGVIVIDIHEHIPSGASVGGTRTSLVWSPGIGVGGKRPGQSGRIARVARMQPGDRVELMHMAEGELP